MPACTPPSVSRTPSYGRSWPQKGRALDPDELNSDLQFLGLVGLMDPPRAEAVAAVADCQAAGIQVKMITGEHAGTAMAIARAVVNRPTVLLADEPTGNLDAESATEILEIFADFHRVGVTVAIATHDQGCIERYKAGVLRLDHGRLIA